jgi:hypothetical protein
MTDWPEREAEKAFRKAIARSPKHDTIAQWRERLTEFAKRIEAALAVSDAELEAADARAGVKKAVDDLERNWLWGDTSEQKVREHLKHVVPGWRRLDCLFPGEDAAAIQARNDALAAAWLPILMMELQRREAARAERDRKAQQRQLEEERKLRKSHGTTEDLIISAGYRTLAAQHHPDAGGSHEKMTKLNQARDNLKTRARPKLKWQWR